HRRRVRDLHRERCGPHRHLRRAHGRRHAPRAPRPPPRVTDRASVVRSGGRPPLRALRSAPMFCRTFNATVAAGLLVFSFGCGGRDTKPAPSQPAQPSTQLDEKPLSVQLSRTDSTLRISVRDNGEPVRTDLWLYTLSSGKLVAFTAFKDPDSKRKNRRRMLPAVIGGQPSNLAPADTGEANGFM